MRDDGRGRACDWRICQTGFLDVMQLNGKKGGVRWIRMALLLVWVWALALAGGPGLHAGHSHEDDHDEEVGGCLVCELVAVSGGDLETVGRVEVRGALLTGFAKFVESQGVRDGVATEVWMEGRGPPFLVAIGIR